MKIKHIVLSIFIALSLLILPQAVAALDCTAVCKYSETQEMDLPGNETCHSTFLGGKNITAQAVGDTIVVNMTEAEASFEEISKVCAVLDYKGASGVEDPATQCKIIDIDFDSGRGSTTFSPKSRGLHTVTVFADSTFEGGACGTGPVSVNLVNSTLPIATLTPIPRSDCADVGASCIAPGFVNNVNCPNLEDFSKGVGQGCIPICSGLTCSLIDQNIGTGEVVNAPTPPLDPDLENVIDLAAANCGIQGLQCCTPNVGAFGEPGLNDGSNEKWFSGVFNFFLGMIFPWVEEAKDSAITTIYSSTDASLCVGSNVKPQLEVDGKKVDLLNTFDVGNNQYLNTNQSCSGSDVIGYKCIPAPTSFPFSESNPCTCVSLDGDDSVKAAVKPDGMTDTEIKDDVCTRGNTGLNEACLRCINNQTDSDSEAEYWTVDGTCENRETAMQKLQAKVTQFFKETDVGKDLATYMNVTCDGDKNCEACLFGGEFFGPAGCTEFNVSTAHFEMLCKNVNDDEYNDCLQCQKQGKVWTAVGCMDLDLQTIIQEQIFGWGMGLAGLSALLCIIYSAFLMQTAVNNPEKISHAQELMTSCITGLVVIIFSVFILNVIGVDILRVPGFESAPTPTPVPPTPTITPIQPRNNGPF